MKQILFLALVVLIMISVVLCVVTYSRVPEPNIKKENKSNEEIVVVKSSEDGEIAVLVTDGNVYYYNFDSKYSKYTFNEKLELVKEWLREGRLERKEVNFKDLVIFTTVNEKNINKRTQYIHNLIHSDSLKDCTYFYYRDNELIKMGKIGRSFELPDDLEFRDFVIEFFDMLGLTPGNEHSVRDIDGSLVDLETCRHFYDRTKYIEDAWVISD